MPRGLGDDPLSRQRKSSRNGKRATVEAHSSSTISVDSSNDPSSGQTLIQGQPVAEVAYSSPQSPSYNDVFFQRRADGSAGGGSSDTHDVISEPDIEESTVSAPTVEELIVPETTALSTIAATPIMPAPVLLADSPEPQENREAATPVLLADSPEPQENREAATPVLLADSPEPQENREAAKIDSDGFLDESNFEPQSEVQVSQPEVQDHGFFKRIFGIFRK